MIAINPSALQSHNPLKATLVPLYAVGVVTSRFAEDGAYLRVSGPQGRLRACSSGLTAKILTAAQIVSYIIHLKSDVVPGLWPGAAALFRVGKAEEFQICTPRFSHKKTYVVTKNGFMPVAWRREVPVFFRTARASARCMGGHYLSLSTGQATNRLCI